MLLNRGVSVNVTDKNHQNCLMLAVIKGKDDIINFLLSFNRKIQETNYQACDTDAERIDLRSVDKNGNSVLHHACREGRSEVAVRVIHLLHEASFIDLANKHRKTLAYVLFDFFWSFCAVSIFAFYIIGIAFAEMNVTRQSISIVKLSTTL